jgi:hypothetical protein
MNRLWVICSSDAGFEFLCVYFDGGSPPSKLASDEVPDIMGPAFHDACTSHDMEAVACCVLHKYEYEKEDNKHRFNETLTASGRRRAGVSIGR